MKRGAEQDISTQPNKIQNIINIFEAAKAGDIEIINLYHQRGGDLNIINDNEDTSLIVATKHGQVEAIKLLVQLGADLEMENNIGYTAITESIMNKQPAAFNVLFDLDANIVFDPKDNCWTPFMQAARYNQREALIKIRNKLIALNIDLKIEFENINDDGNTPLMEAAEGEHVDIIETLVTEFGVDVNYYADDAYSALIVAIASKQIAAAAKLLQLGATINDDDIKVLKNTFKIDNEKATKRLNLARSMNEKSEIIHNMVYTPAFKSTGQISEMMALQECEQIQVKDTPKLG